MTFIAGFKCPGGLAMFSDSLESGGGAKRYRKKLHVAHTRNFGVCWGVAGSAHVADKFSDKLMDLIACQIQDEYDPQRIELTIEECLKWVRKQYSREDAIEVIVGLFGELDDYHHSELYRGDSLTACLAPVPQYCIAGMDVTLAALMLETAESRGFWDLEDVKKVGVLITRLMKEYAIDVGGATRCEYYEVGAKEWERMYNGEIKDIERSIPLEDIKTHIAKLFAKRIRRTCPRRPKRKTQ